MGSINWLLQKEPSYGSQIQQLVVRDLKDHPTEEEGASFIELWLALKFAAGRKLTAVEAGYQALGSILSKCKNLQTLVLAGGILLFSLVAVSQEGAFHSLS